MGIGDLTYPALRAPLRGGDLPAYLICDVFETYNLPKIPSSEGCLKGGVGQDLRNTQTNLRPKPYTPTALDRFSALRSKQL